MDCNWKLFEEVNRASSNFSKPENSPSISYLDPEETKVLCAKCSEKPGHNSEDESPKEIARSKSNRRDRSLQSLILVAVVMLVINISLNISVAVLQNKTQREDPVIHPLEEPICLPCVRLVKNPFDPQRPDSLTDRLDRRVQDGVQMCCAGNEDQMSAMMEAALRDQDVRPVPDVTASDLGLELTPVSAHIHLRANNESDSKVSLEKTHTTAQFATNQHRSLSEHANGVTLLPAALRIEHSGLYYLYLSVLTTPSRGDVSKQNRNMDWEQLIYRTKQDQTLRGDVLLQTSHTPRWNSSQQKDTRFIGGTFLLNKGDHISVCISLAGKVSYLEESSFLGLVMLSSVSPSAVHTDSSSH